MTKHYDYVIVGGGISGVYSAWRLKTQYPDAKIAVYEGSDRIGGRLMTVTPPGMPETRCELGGMRYIRQAHPLVASLVEEELKMEGRAFPVDQPDNIAYLRGKRLRLKDLGDPDKIPYFLVDEEHGQTPSQLIDYALSKMAPDIKFKNLSEKQWIEFQSTFKYNGLELYKQGFWNVLMMLLSSEAYLFALDGGGYETVIDNWNAADAVPFNVRDFGKGVNYIALVEGYQALPIKIAEVFEKVGGELYMEHWLQTFTRNEKGFELTFNLSAKQNEDGEKVTIQAEKLILAMPRRSLELLGNSWNDLLPDKTAYSDFQDLVRSVTAKPFFKIFVCYPYPWWQSVGVSSGRTVTNLPIRQCYYWGTESQVGDPDNTNSVLLASYDDGHNVSYWEGYREDIVRAKPHLFDFYETRLDLAADGAEGSKTSGEDEWRDYLAPERMVHEVHRQLMEIHGVTDAPKPYAAAYRDWTVDPYGGGVHFWNIHAKSWEVIPKMVHPIDDVPLYICGEAYSDDQGWVEGALRTTEIMLRHFGLKEPEWLEVWEKKQDAKKSK